MDATAAIQLTADATHCLDAEISLMVVPENYLEVVLSSFHIE